MRRARGGSRFLDVGGNDVINLEQITFIKVTRSVGAVVNMTDGKTILLNVEWTEHLLGHLEMADEQA